MKAHLFALISALPSTLGCLHYVGQIYLAPNGPQLQAAWILDDGVLVCRADGGAAWYGTPHGNFRWSQGYDRSDNFIVWDNWQFC
ncbi:uncharacterized protein P174DRAFT_465246 [Aspergillus novofumigatus IBT 16806]|uniref:Bulb-type lectin domain-containing protein n=1 Tax=Aspergillus novofumigatus (strain IBT 16806) TaxID=1392255 RepID=A0A2I1BSC8_ASPN1|nr:uncharacterized protein P174DRAFT_465246 [Aspergillus novofumigatus IBT 16806]PKX88317.1 hypothetical protein P174DRAFT_465246 [Aspergillus novofumigatus IBT 16806]